MAYLPTIIAVVLLALSSLQIHALLRYHLHPWRILLAAFDVASTVGLIGILGLLPEGAWPIPALITMAGIVGVLIANRRVIRSALPTDLEGARAKLLTPPHWITLAMYAFFALVILVFAVVAAV